jgi:hypothetical protein
MHLNKFTCKFWRKIKIKYIPIFNMKPYRHLDDAKIKLIFITLENCRKIQSSQAKIFSHKQGSVDRVMEV